MHYRQLIGGLLARGQESSVAASPTAAPVDDIRRHVLHLTDRKHLAHQTEIAHSRGGGVGGSGGRRGEAGGHQQCPSTRQPD